MFYFFIHTFTHPSLCPSIHLCIWTETGAVGGCSPRVYKQFQQEKAEGYSKEQQGVEREYRDCWIAPYTQTFKGHYEREKRKTACGQTFVLLTKTRERTGWENICLDKRSQCERTHARAGALWFTGGIIWWVFATNKKHWIFLTRTYKNAWSL